VLTSSTDALKVWALAKAKSIPIHPRFYRTVPQINYFFSFLFSDVFYAMEIAIKQIDKMRKDHSDHIILKVTEIAFH